LLSDNIKSEINKANSNTELLKSELSVKPEIAAFKSKSITIADQIQLSASKNIEAVKLLHTPVSGTESSSVTTKTPDFMNNDAVSSQTQQPNNSQNINRAAEIPLTVSVSNRKWNQKFAEHVSMLALKGTTNAHIKLDPPELGPMTVRIHHHGNDTQIQFVVNNPIAKELVDSGSQRLREMLEQHGFENVDVDVNEFTKEEHNSAEADNKEQESIEMIEDITNNSENVSQRQEKSSLIDIFA